MPTLISIFKSGRLWGFFVLVKICVFESLFLHSWNLERSWSLFCWFWNLMLQTNVMKRSGVQLQKDHFGKYLSLYFSSGLMVFSSLHLQSGISLCIQIYSCLHVPAKCLYPRVKRSKCNTAESSHSSRSVNSHDCPAHEANGAVMWQFLCSLTMDEHLVNVDVWSNRCAPPDIVSQLFPMHKDKHPHIEPTQPHAAPTSASVMAHSLQMLYYM